MYYILTAEDIDKLLSRPGSLIIDFLTPCADPQFQVKVIKSGTIRYGFLLVFYSNFVPKMHCP